MAAVRMRFSTGFLQGAGFSESMFYTVFLGNVLHSINTLMQEFLDSMLFAYFLSVPGSLDKKVEERFHLSSIFV
jgi:hypothetical protein